MARVRQHARRHAAILRLGLLLVLLVGLAACRLDVDTRLEVSASGSGTIAVDFRLDDELVESLTPTGFDPVPAEVPGWEVTEARADDGLQITVSSTFADLDELQDRIDALHAGLDDEDPRLIESIDLSIDDDGSSRMDARVGVILPSSAGARGPDLPDRAALVALASDPEAFGATFTVVLPGPVQESNADRVEGVTATWDLPIDEMTEVTVTAGPASALGAWAVPAILGGLLAVLVIVGVVVLRRRRRQSRTAPHGRVERLQRWK